MGNRGSRTRLQQMSGRSVNSVHITTSCKTPRDSGLGLLQQLLRQTQHPVQTVPGNIACGGKGSCPVSNMSDPPFDARNRPNVPVDFWKPRCRVGPSTQPNSADGD